MTTRELHDRNPDGWRVPTRRGLLRAGLALAFLLASVTHSAHAAPALINYQGRLTDSVGGPLDGSFELTFRILPAATGGVPIWEETHPSILAIDGVFQVLLGSLQPLDPSVFDSDALWLEIEVEGEELTPRQRITSEAFALRAQGADTLLQTCSEGDILRYRSGAWTCAGVGTCLPGQVDVCYTGPGGTQGVGACQSGTQVCGALSEPGPCIGEVTPSAEICDSGQDEDCDGLTDEDCGVCEPGQVEACYSGPPATQGVGACQAGSRTCSGASLWGPCQGETLPAAEICNAIDDDCDGSSDDGNPGGGGSCASGQPGSCADGTLSCQAGTLACIPTNSPQPETCNDRDDDCDGQTDEGNPGGGDGCVSGQPGICSAGTTTCQSGLLQCLSNASPQVELCNALDDDCDGATDEGNPGGGAGCGTGMPGICALGTTTCLSGALSCSPTATPVAELCNALDDDCDGSTDEGNPGGGGACATGQLGVCADGSVTCQAGALSCLQNVSPQAELCNALDDDCDGQVDEGNPEGGGSCSTGLSGICAAGVLVCNTGSLFCGQLEVPVAEICNGLDDDCDGVIDEGVCPSGIDLARLQPDGPTSVPVVAALVTYLRPAIAAEGAAFFVQQTPTGPALLITVDPATLSFSPPLARGDVLDFTIDQMATASAMRLAPAISSVSRRSSGNSFLGFVQPVGNAADLVVNAEAYESELVSMTATIVGSATGAGTGFISHTISTVGIPADANLRLRIPTSLDGGLGPFCTINVNATPLSRFNSVVYANVWVAADLQIISCP